jgi:hypothetical protein
VVFGFNSDIKHGETVYHVQSEVRQREQLLQTQVFVGGRCIGKRASSFAAKLRAGESDEELHKLLKAQHREVVEGIRAGAVAGLFAHSPRLEWIAAEPLPADELLMVQFRVTPWDHANPCARVLGRVDAAGQQPAFLNAETSPDGGFQLRLPLHYTASADATLSVQVTHAEGTLRGRFRLKRT